MEIRITTSHMLKVFHLFFWIIFVGLCIDAGGFLSNAVYVSTINPAYAKHFWLNNDFSVLYAFDKGHFLVQTMLISIVAIMKAIMFYMIVKLLYDKKLNLARPFNKEVRHFISLLSYLSLGIGLFAYAGVNYAERLMKQGVIMPGIESLKLGGADVWLFMGIILLVIAQIFKKGIEIQTENELTV